MALLEIEDLHVEFPSQGGVLRAVEVRRFLREQGVAEFKLPDRVESVDALPLTPVGKVDKKQLRLWLAERAQG